MLICHSTTCGAEEIFVCHESSFIFETYDEWDGYQKTSGTCRESPNQCHNHQNFELKFAKAELKSSRFAYSGHWVNEYDDKTDRIIDVTISRLEGTFAEKDNLKLRSGFGYTKSTYLGTCELTDVQSKF